MAKKKKGKPPTKLVVRKGRVPMEPMPGPASWRRRLFLLALRMRIQIRHSFTGWSFWTWLRSFAGPGIGVIGWQVMTASGPYSYFLGVGIIYFGLAVWLVESLADRALRNRMYLRMPMLVVCVLTTVFFTVKVALRKAPLELDSYAMRGGNHPTGQDIDGIIWDPHFTDLRAWIRNDSDNDYENLYLNIRPDRLSYKAVIAGDDHGCHLVSIGGGGILINMKALGTTKAVMHIEQDRIEAMGNTGEAFQTLATDGGYRLECGKLASHDSIEVLFALVADDPNATSQLSPQNLKPGQKAISLFGSNNTDPNMFDSLGPRPTKTNAVTVDGHYNLGPKPFIERRTIIVGEGN